MRLLPKNKMKTSNSKKQTGEANSSNSSTPTNTDVSTPPGPLLDQNNESKGKSSNSAAGVASVSASASTSLQMDSSSSGSSCLKTRRIVKAMAPPTPPPSASSQDLLDSSLSDAADWKIVEEECPPRSLIKGGPAIQREEMMEKTQQWRKERIEASAAIRKEHKEKEIMDHRMRSRQAAIPAVANGDGYDDDDHGGKNEEGKLENDQGGKKESSRSYAVCSLPAILSVLTKFPEHKRKKPALCEPQNGKKKLKAVQDDDDENDAVIHDPDDEKKKDAADDLYEDKRVITSWSSKTMEIIKSNAPAGVLVAVIAILATRWMKR